MKYATKPAIRDFIIFIAIVLLSITFVFGKPVKPLANTRYSYNQLVRRGYECNKFRGKVCINYKRYLELVNNKTISK